MVHRLISVFIFLACAHASDIKKLAVFHFQNQGLETDAAQSIPENIQGELQKTSNYEFLDGQKIETIITINIPIGYIINIIASVIQSNQLVAI